MTHRWLRRPRSILIAALALALVAAGVGIFWPPSLQRQVARVEKEVVAIRGLPFKQPVTVKWTSSEEWREFVSREWKKAGQVEHYWAVVRMLGLYRGPDREAPEQIAVNLLSSVHAGYDARGDEFLLMVKLDEPYRGVVFAHEVYHALQDQYFDLQRYLLDKALEVDVNADEVMARQFVVEGEASYVDAIYQARLATTGLPTRQQIADVIDGQSKWNPEAWEKAIADPMLDEKVRTRVQGALEAHKVLPSFMFERMYTPYIDGPSFIQSVHARGWTEVEKLYGEYPPVSTAQILHPEKWFAREEPVHIAWSVFQSDPLFSDWQLLAENVLGERLWRIVFREQGLRSDAESAAAGWNGDRYAVFKHRRENTFLMLMYTSWDTAADAAEFATAYTRLLEAKYPDGAMPVRVQLRGRDVQIVEGGSAEALDAFLAFNAAAVLKGGTQPVP